ncbi:hypothetical protein WJX72_012302 [[Myrmecia] bisecta]|uniref:Uncharacterized protein n=1 Tax=[Myrmecia] bisecta TaxID=41462 RepID=A0AAW1P9G2_9CHLO
MIKWCSSESIVGHGTQQHTSYQQIRVSQESTNLKRRRLTAANKLVHLHLELRTASLPMTMCTQAGICTLLTILLVLSGTHAQDPNQYKFPPSSKKDTILIVALRINGPQVEPFTTVKQNAVLTGVANVIGDGIIASDVRLSIVNQTQASTRRLLQSGVPGVGMQLNISTNSAQASAQASRLQAAANNAQLQSAFGMQGLQTHSVLVLSTQTVAVPAPAAPASPAVSSPSSKAGSPAPVPIPKSGGTPGFVIPVVVVLVLLLVLAVAGVLGHRWYMRRRAARKQAEYITQYFSTNSLAGETKPYTRNPLPPIRTSVPTAPALGSADANVSLQPGSVTGASLKPRSPRKERRLLRETGPTSPADQRRKSGAYEHVDVEAL